MIIEFKQHVGAAVLIAGFILGHSTAFADFSAASETIYKCGDNKYIAYTSSFSCDIEEECKGSATPHTYWVLKNKKRIKLKDIDIPDYGSFDGGELVYKKQHVFFNGAGLFLDKEHKKPCKELDFQRVN